MTNDDCVARLDALLIAESRDETPPWASEAIELVPECGETAVTQLQQQVATKSATSFLALEGLRMQAHAAWQHISAEERAAIYANQLATARWYNPWGFPGQPLDTANALISLGAAAVPFLRPLLESQRPAPSFGSETAAMSHVGRYRVRDYAWGILAEILGERPAFNENADERDRLIDAFIHRL
jgi:hypothetical protein